LSLGLEASEAYLRWTTASKAKTAALFTVHGLLAGLGSQLPPPVGGVLQGVSGVLSGVQGLTEGLGLGAVTGNILVVNPSAPTGGVEVTPPAVEEKKPDLDAGKHVGENGGLPGGTPTPTS
jgi:hypothetical protein